MAAVLMTLLNTARRREDRSPVDYPPVRRLALLLLALAGCGPDGQERRPVLVVTIDTLRADAVGEGRPTPAINAFLREAARFPSCRTVTPLTFPSHATLFTGLFPPRHGIHDNVTDPLRPRGERAFPLLAEEFREAGYATAAFVARAVLSKTTGLASGFDRYECPDAEVAAEEQAEAAVRWMEGARGRPWFLWVHLFDPHEPYRPFPGDAERGPTAEGDPPEVLYAGEVRRADAAFARLLRAAGKGTIVVLASDHGEGLMEHGEPTHGPLCYGSTIDAVLALRAPGFEASRDDLLRSIADVAPTLRRLCGLPSQPADGKDLGGAPHETLVAESLFTWRIHGWGQCFAVTDGSRTLVESGPRQDLFDRRADPGETRPLPLSDPAYEKLDRALNAYRSGRTIEERGDLIASVPPYGELRRRGIRYLDRSANSKLLDPAEHLATWAAIEAVPRFVEFARMAKDAAALESALRILDELRERTPRTPRIDHYRALACEALGDVTGKISWYRDAAWAELAAVEKGYVQPETVVPAIDYCVRADDAEALRALVGLLKREGRRLDGEPARRLAAAAGKLGIEEAEGAIAGN
jgi:arylsulfatase A-like enzyme